MRGGSFRERNRRFWRDFGVSEDGRARMAAAREGRPLPPPAPHHYRRCRDEFCPEEACQAYRDGREDAEMDGD